MEATSTQPVSAPPKAKPRWRWVPHFWLGSNLTAWSQLLRAGRFAVHPRFLPIAAADSVGIAMNSILAAGQRGVFGRALESVKFDPPPLFILGHWRTGTTLLHELLAGDPGHVCPTTYQCFCPNHFLLTQKRLPPLLSMFIPDKRPMDNVSMGWDRPQEDEFAIANLGAGSPYCQIAFPNRPEQFSNYLDLRSLDPEVRQKWLRTWVTFLRGVMHGQDGKRLILKSPPHTARLRYILEVFPDARFVHMVRDPEAVYPSTLNLWKKLYQTHGYQKPKCDDLPDRVAQTFRRMYACFDEDRAAIPEGHLFDLRYEDLVANPMQQLEAMYQQLGLGDVSGVRSAAEAHLQQQADYQTNRHSLTPEDRQRVAEVFGDYCERYGYGARTTEGSSTAISR